MHKRGEIFQRNKQGRQGSWVGSRKVLVKPSGRPVTREVMFRLGQIFQEIRANVHMWPAPRRTMRTLESVFWSSERLRMIYGRQC
jgi:hypothetical protein